MDVKVGIYILEKCILWILGRAIRITEHPFYIGLFIETSTEIAQTNLFIVIEVLLSVRIKAGCSIQRTIGRVEIEEVQPFLHIIGGTFKIAIKYRHINTVQHLAISKNSICITNRRMKITAKRHIKLAFAVDAIQTIKAGTIKEHQILRTVYIVKFCLIKEISHIKEIPFLGIFIRLREIFLL